jgi:hypothetical protein
VSDPWRCIKAYFSGFFFFSSINYSHNILLSKNQKEDADGVCLSSQKQKKEFVTTHVLNPLSSIV